MRSKRRPARLLHVAIAGYVLLQLALPIPGLLRGFHETDGYFSWNMFAHNYRCRWGYAVHGRDGRSTPLDLRQHLRDARVVSRLFHRDVLPRYHEWLCENVVPTREGARLAGSMRCALLPGEFVELVREGVDLCRAENFGVLRDEP